MKDCQRELEDKSLRFLLDLLEQRADPGPGQCATQTKQKQSEAAVYSNGGAYSRLEQVRGVRGTCLIFTYLSGLEGVSRSLQSVGS